MRQRNVSGGPLALVLVFGGCHTDWSVRPELDAGSVKTLTDGQVAPQDGDELIDDASSIVVDVTSDAATRSDATACDGASGGQCVVPSIASPACGSDCRTDAAIEPSTACVATPESCNFKDDDCDGTVDEGLPANLPSLTHTLTLPLAPSEATSSTRLLEHVGGGATLLSSNGLDPASGLKIAQIDRAGRIVGEQRAFADLGHVQRVVAATSGSEFAIGAVRADSAAGPFSTDYRPEVRIHAYQHPNNVKTAELSVFRSAKACDTATIADIAVKVSGGTLKVAWILNRFEGSLGNSGQDCSGPQAGGDLSVWTAERSGTGSWTPPVRGMNLGNPSLIGTVGGSIHPWPCGDGWALVRTTPESGTSLVHLGESGEVQHITAGLPTDGSPLMAGTAVQFTRDCGQTPSITVPIVPPAVVQSAASAFTQSAPSAYSRVGAVGSALERTKPILRRWTLAADSVRFTDTELQMQGLAVAGATFGGATHYVVLNASNEYRMVTLPESGAPTIVGSPIANVEQAGPASLGSAYLGLLSGADIFSLVHTGEAFVLAAARTLNSPATTLNSLRAPGDTDPPVAVTYTLGCGL
jgi:hypothetical protein